MSENNQPILSIITVVYNRVNDIEKTIKSIISQTYKNIEYIIIDGNSTDGTVDVIKKYEDKIDYWVSEPDSGIYNAMNKGIAKATGKYIQFMNTGDYFLDNDMLEKIFSSEQDVDILYGDYYLSEDKKQTRYYPNELTMFFLYIASLGHQASFIKRSLFDKYMYNENYKIVSDWEFFFRKIIFENCTTKHLNYPVCFFDLTGISESQSTKELEKKERNDVISKLVPEKLIPDFEKLYKLRVFEHTRCYRYFFKYFL